MEPLIFAVLILTVVQWLIALYFEARIKESVKHEYDRKLVDYSNELDREKKSEAVAELFAKWIKYSGNVESVLDKKEILDYYEDLNKMSFQLTLWVKDASLLESIMLRLQNTDDSKDIRALLVDIRKILLKNENDLFKKDIITIWSAVNVISTSSPLAVNPFPQTTSL